MRGGTWATLVTLNWDPRLPQNQMA